MEEANEPSASVERTCQFTGMTDKQKTDLQQSWRAILGTEPQAKEKNMEEFGKILVLWLLGAVPNANKQFKKFKGTAPREELLADLEFVNHALMVSKWIDSMVDTVFKPVELEMKLHHLAVMHLSLKPKIGSNYFNAFREKFPSFVASSLGKSESDEEVKLWAMFANVLAAEVRKSEKLLKPEKSCVVL